MTNKATIRLLTGTMFSGKTGKALAIGKAMDIDKRFTMYFRYGKFKGFKMSFYDMLDTISSRDGISADAMSVESEDEIGEVYKRFMLPKVMVIDEVQFFQPSIADFCVNLRDKGVSSILAGFDKWYTGEKVETVARIESIADVVSYSYVRCGCGKLATHSLRLSGSDELIELGNNYVPVCEKCFYERKRK